MARNRTIALALSAASLLVATRAAAYCRTSSCPDVGTSAVCTPAGPSDCGVVLRWASPCIGFSIQQDASAQISLEAAAEVFQTAFATWMAADCGGVPPRIRIEDVGPVACHEQEYNQEKGNANVIMFRDTDWPYAGTSTTLALTTVTYNLDTGEIYDADMELNSFGADFTIDEPGVVFDLRSIAQHETGHFLGLAHSPNTDATMYASYKQGDVGLRSLTADDMAGICDAYPPGDPIDDACDTTPRHGFSSDCAIDQPDPEITGGCCTVAPGGDGLNPRSAPLFAAFLALSISARRRRAAARPTGSP